MVIAEFCQNHQGKRDVLASMIRNAGKAGATFAKIQTFFAEDLTPEWKAQHFNKMKELELTWEDHAFFVKECQDNNLQPVTSVYSAKYMMELQQCGFQWIKLGSADSHKSDLRKYLIATGFKVIMSTGGKSNLKSFDRHSGLSGVLHCISKYPHHWHEANLNRMIDIKYLWPNTSYGFSDHTNPIGDGWDLATKHAMILGASFVERHFTTLYRGDTKDGPVSIGYDQLKELCRFDKLTLEEKFREIPQQCFISRQDPNEVD